LKIPLLLADASLKAIERLALASGQVLLAFDYDGTLVPLAEDPSDALCSDATREVLKRLVANPRVKVAVLSGRTLAEIRRLVKIPNITYAALNGLTILMDGEREEHDDLVHAERIMGRVREDLDGKLDEWQDLRIEDRGVGLALHHGRLTKKEADAAYDRLAEVLTGERVQIHRGKRAIEVFPDIAWDKGVAVRRFMEHHRKLGTVPLLVCAGDEPIDMPALRMARDMGGVAIGMGREAARHGNYVAENTTELIRFLELLDGWLSGKTAAA
jgi:trehalose 6-phosphate phosphatase